MLRARRMLSKKRMERTRRMLRRSGVLGTRNAEDEERCLRSRREAMSVRRMMRTWALYLKEHFLEYPSPNFEGSRDVENSWIAAHMPKASALETSRALDFGCGSSPLGLLAAQQGFRTTAIDLCPVRFWYVHPNLTFCCEDLLSSNFPPNSFALVINCSAVEHVGLLRYGGKEHEDGDLLAMRRLWEITEAGGTMLLTTAVGRECVIPKLHRVYGKKRLADLLQGWKRVDWEWQIKNGENQWVKATEQEAFAVEPNDHYYALFLAELRKG